MVLILQHLMPGKLNCLVDIGGYEVGGSPGLAGGEGGCIVPESPGWAGAAGVLGSCESRSNSEESLLFVQPDMTVMLASRRSILFICMADF